MGYELHIGSVLGGKYRIDALIGEGGMGIVARATQLGLGRRVAVKLLRPEICGNAQVVERFYREARAASRIDGPHSVQILDVGKTDAGSPYMVMELLEGEDLDHVLRRKGKQPLDVVVWLMVQACAGVGDAHAARVVHRDLKPSNLFLAARAGGASVLKVLDFGISRLDEEASALTRTMTQLGTPHYMSPEQIERPKSVDHRTDIWALGCIFHKLLTGETPFRGQGAQLISAVIRNTRRKPSELVTTLPKAVDEIVDKCLAPSPDARYQSASELASAIRALRRAPSIGDSGDSEPVTTPIPKDEDEHPEADDTHVSAAEDSGKGRTLALDVGVRTAHATEHTLAMDLAPRTSRAPSRPSSSGTPMVDSGRRAHDETGARGLRPRLATAAVAGLALVGLAASWLIAPRALMTRGAAEAARSGITLRYASPRPTLAGIEVRDLEVLFADAPSAKLHATRATFSYAMDAVSLGDADLDVGDSAQKLAQAGARALGEGLTRVEARNLAFRYDVGGTVVSGRGASVTATRGLAGSGPSSSEGSQGSQGPQVEASAPEVSVSAYGATFSHLHARARSADHGIELDASTDATELRGLVLRGVLEPAGFSLSLRAARQRVAASELSITTFEPTAPASREVELALDARGDLEHVSGALSMSMYGLDGGTPLDFDAHIAFHGERGSIVVDGGSAHMGPFVLTPSGVLAEDGALRARVDLDSGLNSCAELRRAATVGVTSLYGVDVPALTRIPGEIAASGHARITLTIGARIDDARHAPEIALALKQRDACGLSAFDRATLTP